MAGVGFILLVTVIGVIALVWAKIDSERSKPDPTKSPEYRELRAALMNIRELAQSNRDVSPIFADVILGEVADFERKELGPHA